MSILASVFHSICKKKAATDLESCIEKPLTLQTNIFRNRLGFANDAMKDKWCQICENHLRYNRDKWKKKGDFDILNKISENVILVQLMDNLGNVNHAISILGQWIFESNYEKEFYLTRESLDLIFSPSVGEL